MTGVSEKFRRISREEAALLAPSLAAGKSEAWVSDRTGHRSSVMINAYRRAARTAAELGLGELLPLDVAIAAGTDPGTE